MKGDFTRSTFRPKKHYSGVRLQQGRVQLDAEWNEQADIAAQRAESETRDVVGRCGVPMEDPGFKISGGSVPLIGKGHLYLDGILVENDKEIQITEQREFLPDEPLSNAGGDYLAYLDVWQRHVTALEDELIRESALGGPDTATRTQTVWQVRLIGPLRPLVPPLTCSSEPKEWQKIVEFVPGKLRAHIHPGTTPATLCEAPAEAGYRRLENQLYRVEIHQQGRLGKATFKWSRDNGSIVTPWNGQDGNNLIVGSLGRDQVLGFAAGQTVELTDDDRELRGEPGILVKLSNAEGQILTLDPSVDRSTFGRNPKVRRWDSDLEIEINDENWISLEDGVEVCFLGDDCDYKTGDYWMIPARSAKSGVEWPEDENNPTEPAAVPRQGIVHHYCRLATLCFNGDIFTVTGDCRPKFPPLTMMTGLYYVGGDGQEAMPGEELKQWLEVRVACGGSVLEGATVRFTAEGTGRLARIKGDTATSTVNTIVIDTGTDGIARCVWKLETDAAKPSQQVTALLMDADGNPVKDGQGNLVHTIRFTANLSIASQVAYNPTTDCPDLGLANTVQKAIDVLCRRPTGRGCCIPIFKDNPNEYYRNLGEAIPWSIDNQRNGKNIDISLCLMPGDHYLSPKEVDNLNTKMEKLDDDFANGKLNADIHIKITGCGSGTRLHVDQAPLIMKRLASFTLRDVEIHLAKIPGKIPVGAINFMNCGRIALDSCCIHGIVDNGALLSIGGASSFCLQKSVLEATQSKSLQNAVNVLYNDIARKIYNLFENIESVNFYEKLIDAARSLQILKPKEKGELLSSLQKRYKKYYESLSTTEQDSYEQFFLKLREDKPDSSMLAHLLKDIRIASIYASPGVALAILDGQAETDIENNLILGLINLYGLTIGPIPEKKFIDGWTAIVKKTRITGTSSDLKMSGNRIARFQISEDYQAGPKNGAYRKLFITNNVIELGQNVIAGKDIVLTSNSFVGRYRKAGVVIARSAIYVGNHAYDKEVELKNISTLPSEQAANILKIV